MKLFKWIGNNILFLFTLFLLAFIPLYPKLPLLDIVNTWVYVRVEDFIVVFVLLVWVYLLFRKKVTLKTPLTMPILLFWIVGAIATIHGALLIFPWIANVFPNVALLSMLRRIEYLSLFFVAYSGMRDKRYFPYVVAVVVVTLLLVVGYGFGQKELGFPAYLTMNEEFAKGEPIRLSEQSRVPSTFAGHYDLAAYLVLIIPIVVSLIFGVKNWFIKLFFLLSAGLGFVLLDMTVSRISFVVLFVALGLVLYFHKKRFIIFSFPIIIALGLLFVSTSPAILARFNNTIQEVDVLVNAETGEAIGHVSLVKTEKFKDKVIKWEYLLKKEQERAEDIQEYDLPLATPSSIASPSAIVPFNRLPQEVTVLDTLDVSNGENLPEGTGYINLSLSPVTRKIGEYFVEKKEETSMASASADVLIISGNYLVKRAAVFDRSFTTRFQGEWPNAIEAFTRNVLFGSGYGSISLAIDNNYFRLLGEIGFLGFAAFFIIFLTVGIYIRKILPDVDSPLIRSFVLGFVAGLVGLALNAIFIDVFEASKIAFVLWLLTGVVLGTLHFYQTKNIELYKEIKNVLTSTYAVIIYLGIASIFIFSSMLNNFFVGDDFTWFRWAADCVNGCITQYFTQSDGFFYRPGTKLYFFLMYKIFWLNQAVYHIVSIFLHFAVASLVFLLAKKILGNFALAVVASFIFLILSGYSEAVFWISSTGFLFTTLFSLSSILFFALWDEKKERIYFIVSLVFLTLGLLFHELGVVTPLLILLYKFVKDESFKAKETYKKTHYMLLFVPLIAYGLMRLASGSHWFSGDYSYNLVKLPFNIVGNALGYSMLTLFGPKSLTFYQILRSVLKEQTFFALIATIVLLVIFYFVYRFIRKRIEKEDRKIILFGTGFFILSLLPFLGLGNITSRYSYMASIGVVILFTYILDKLYMYLKTQGKDIALASTTLVLVSFYLLHLIQIQQIHSDWRTAGDRARQFLIAIDAVYADYWAKEPMTFYFVNTPIKTGEAWIFPVGLRDGLWFSMRNPNITVNQSPSVETALSQVDGSINQKIFEFTQDGKVVEHRKILDVE